MWSRKVKAPRTGLAWRRLWPSTEAPAHPGARAGVRREPPVASIPCDLGPGPRARGAPRPGPRRPPAPPRSDLWDLDEPQRSGGVQGLRKPEKALGEPSAAFPPRGGKRAGGSSGSTPTDHAALLSGPPTLPHPPAGLRRLSAAERVQKAPSAETHRPSNTQTERPTALALRSGMRAAMARPGARLQPRVGGAAAARGALAQARALKAVLFDCDGVILESEGGCHPPAARVRDGGGGGRSSPPTPTPSPPHATPPAPLRCLVRG